MNRIFRCALTIFTAGALFASCSKAQLATDSESEPQVAAAEKAQVLADIGQAMPAGDILIDELRSTHFVLSDGTVVLDPGAGVNGDSSNFEEQLAIANKGLAYLGDTDLSRSKRVAVVEREKLNIVIFDLELSPGTLGGSYAYAVAMDKRDDSLVRVLVSD